jgi:hypothetical protein
VSNENCSEIKTHILRSVTFFLPQKSCFYEIMPKNLVEPEAAEEKMAHAFACWIGKATRTQSDAHAFAHPHSQAQRFRDHTSILRYVFEYY